MRLEKAAALSGELIVVAPTRLREALGPAAAKARWAAADPSDGIAAPTAGLRDAVAAAHVVLELHRQSPLTAVRYGAVNADGWAIGLFSRQSADLDGVELVVEIPPDVTPLTRPLALGDDHSVAVERGAARAALRDADVVEGDEGGRAALVSAGFHLGSPRGVAPPVKPMASAVVSHYNLERYLPACLESLRRQTLPVEVVLVDDGSSPAGLAVVEEEARRDPRLKVVRQTNQGLWAARNAGIAACSGELVLIVDADNLMRPRMVEVLSEALLRRPEADAAVPAFRAFADEDGRTLFHYCPVEADAAPLFIANVAGDACALHRRSALLAVGGFREAGTTQGALEDWDLWLRYIAAGRATAVVPQVLFDYRVREESLLRRRSRMEQLHGYFEVASAHPAVLAKVSHEVSLLAAARLRELLDGASHDGQIAAAQQFEVVRRQAAEHLAAVEAGFRHELTTANAAAAAAREELSATVKTLNDLRAELAELRSSSAVRAAELLRAVSPDLHRGVGRVLRALLRVGRQG